MQCTAADDVNVVEVWLYVLFCFVNSYHWYCHKGKRQLFKNYGRYQ